MLGQQRGGLPFFIGGVGNAVWSGTRLAPLLEEAEPSKKATEVIFWGADRGTVTVNDEPLPVERGAPVRLIAPGWYGVANVKWLTHIELVDQRYAGRFMARAYVTFRERLDEAGEAFWTFNTVGHDRLKSAPAKVTQRDGRYTIIGVAGNVQPSPEDAFLSSRRTYWENNGQITRHITIA